MQDITAVTVNWLTARRTLGAVKNFQKFYPNIPLIIVDDDSQEKDKGEFFSCYNGYLFNPQLEYDSDNSKLKNIPNTTFLQLPPHNVHPKGHGYAVDLAIKNINTRWMFTFHSDYRMTKPGLIENLMDGIDETYAGAGDGILRHQRCPALAAVATIFNVEAGKKHDCTFEPVIYYDDDTTSNYPDLMDPNRKGGIPVQAGSYYTAKLVHLGYKVKWTGAQNEYGIHLRWSENEENKKLWNELY